jgi:hypothetical protein
VYFDQEGRANLGHVLRVIKKTLRKRPELRGTKLVIFTAIGEGPALAYSLLGEFDPRIIAVTFPPDFSVKRGNRVFKPEIAPRLRAFFAGVNITVLTGRLPFDEIEGAVVHNEQVKLIREVLGLWGGSFSLIVQAVLQACDRGEVEQGEMVIGMAGDSAALITASSTTKFLSKEGGFAINEVLCKPRRLTVSRPHPPQTTLQIGRLFSEQPAQDGVGNQGRELAPKREGDT